MVVDTSIVLEPGAGSWQTMPRPTAASMPSPGRPTASHLDDQSDESLSYAGIEFHRFGYDASVDPVYTGTTLRVDTELAAGMFDDANAWCVEVQAYRAQDHGTPRGQRSAARRRRRGPGRGRLQRRQRGYHPWASRSTRRTTTAGVIDDGAFDVSTFWTDADGDGYGC